MTNPRAYGESIPSHAGELRSTITSAGELRLEIVDAPVVQPGPDEVLIRVDAAPLNPSDVGLLLGPADMTRAVPGGDSDHPTLTAPVAAAALGRLALRLDKPMPVGNEGTGIVVRAGSAVTDWIGKRVAMFGGGMYAQYRCLPITNCLLLSDDVTAEEAASAYVNPMTVLGLVETMRATGHRAAIHTAAASNLGAMLVRVCVMDGIPLVNVVRSPEQVAALRGLGAEYVVDSSAANFEEALTEAIVATGATVAFDAVGGPLTAQLLMCMEAAAMRRATTFSPYGTAVLKEVYVYGGLDPRAVEIDRARTGLAWSVSGWLLFQFLAKAGPQAVKLLQARVQDELRTTFASSYKGRISLSDVLRPDAITAYRARKTGEKYLVTPNG